MNVIKTISILCLATFFAFTVSAQSTAAPAAKSTTSQSANAVSASKPEKPGANDKVNKNLKGPKGEVVYTGPKGGNYYIDKISGKKKYLKPASTPAK